MAININHIHHIVCHNRLVNYVCARARARALGTSHPTPPPTLSSLWVNSKPENRGGGSLVFLQFQDHRFGIYGGGKYLGGGGVDAYDGP